MVELFFDRGFNAVDFKDVQYCSLSTLLRLSISEGGEVILRGADSSEEHMGCSPYDFGSYVQASIESNIVELVDMLEGLFPDRVKVAEEFLTEERLKRSMFFVSEEWTRSFSETHMYALGKLYVYLFPVYSQLKDKGSVEYADCFIDDGFYNTSYFKNVSYYGSTSFRSLVENVFGVWRKDLFKAMLNFPKKDLALLSHFRGLVPVDYFVDVMERFPDGVRTEYWGEDFSNLGLLSVTVRKKLLENYFVNNYLTIVKDTLNMLEYCSDGSRFKGASSWDEVHNVAMREAAVVLDASLEATVFSGQSFQELSDSVFDGNVRFSLLKKAKEFIDIGDTLGICLGKSDYFLKTVKGESYCFKLTGVNDGELLGVAEVKKNYQSRSWDVLQLARENNEKFDNQDRIIEHISKILNKDRSL